MKRAINYELPKPIQSFPTSWSIATTAEEFYSIQRDHVDDHERDGWSVNDDAEGITHYYDRFVIVCVPLDAPLDVLVHEAVHVYQRMMIDVGETEPGIEVEAYCIQFIFQQMYQEIERRKACADQSAKS